jgi:hypothetical protein
VPELVRVIATVRQNYGGRWYSTGDVFEVTKSDAGDLIAMRYAALAPEELESKDEAQRYLRRDMRPAR